MLKTNLSIRQSLLADSVSNDETRPQLKGIYCDNGQLISTDGHRMTIVSNWFTGFETGKLYNTDAFIKLGICSEIKDGGKYPNWQQHNPDTSVNFNKINLMIPTSIGLMKSKRTVQIFFYVSPTLSFISLTRIQMPTIPRFKDPFKCPPQFKEFSINAHFLRLLAGEEVTVAFKDEWGPVVITDKTNEWTYIVMPLNMKNDKPHDIKVLELI